MKMMTNERFPSLLLKLVSLFLVGNTVAENPVRARSTVRVKLPLPPVVARA